MKSVQGRHSTGRRGSLARFSAWLLLSASGLVFFGSAGGCGVSASDICDLKCDCEGCNAAEREDCLADVEATVDLAETKGCSDQYQDWLACVESEAECRDGETFAWDGCDIEEDALRECGGGDPCSAAAKKLCDECNFVCSEPDPDKCTGYYECQSKCIVNATCTDIASPAPGGSYESCLAGC